jgi:hypothetical protein
VNVSCDPNDRCAGRYKGCAWKLAVGGVEEVIHDKEFRPPKFSHGLSKSVLIRLGSGCPTDSNCIAS